MKKGKLDNGFEYEVREDVIDDMELLDALHAANTTDPFQLSIVVKKVLGTDEQRARLYDHLRREDGTVPVTDVANAIAAILEDIGEDGKNS